MHSTTYLLIITAALTFGIGLALHLVLMRSTRVRARTAGYTAGVKARQHLIDELNRIADRQALHITELQGEQQQLKTTHRQQLEAAAEALEQATSRSMSDHERSWLKRAAAQLQNASQMHHLLSNSVRSQECRAAAEVLTTLLGRGEPLTPVTTGQQEDAA